MKQMKIKSPIVLLILIALYFSCNRHEQERPFAQLETTSIKVDESGLTAFAKVIYLPKGDPILDYGFMYDKTPVLQYIPDFNFDGIDVSLGNDFNGDIFSGRIEKGLVKGQKYYVRAFIRSEKWIAYGTAISFTSKGSSAISLEKLSPNDTIVPGDFLSVIGKNMGYDSRNVSVKLDNIDIPINSINDTVVTFLIPQFVKDESKITISNRFNDQKVNFVIPFIPAPEVTNIKPFEMADGDTMIIRGKYFSRISDWNRVNFSSNSRGKIIYADKEQIHFRMDAASPASGGPTFRIGVGLRKSDRVLFNYAPIEIHNFFPKEGANGDTLTILGQNFFTTPGVHVVSLEGVTWGWEVLESSNTQLKVLISEINLFPDVTMRTRRLRVSTNAGVTAFSEELFTYK